jgi:UDP-glucuronate 4-epimerase
MEGKPIQVFNHGKMQRDFTYIDDIVEGIVRVMENIPEANPNWNSEFPDPATSYKKYKIYNIGNNKPVQLSEFIAIIEKAIGKKAKKNYMDIQPGDVPATYADINDLINDVDFKPATPLSEGIQNFIDWYKAYYSE